MTRRLVSTAWLLCASLLASGGFAFAALAQPPGPEPGGGPPGMGPRGPHGPPPIEHVLERHAGELGLGADTRAAIRAIAAKARLDERPASEELRTLHEQMRTLLEGDSPKLDDVMQWADRIGAAETELKKSRLRTMLEIRTLLTPEQRQKLVKIFEERRGRRKGFEGERPPPSEIPGTDSRAEGQGEP
ncbi:MAG: periplasmic heavy metal sensor [Proteobacteria bacterium]|nr:periplasmic heavy metal sensor [Pseudomonadota bacterium]